MIFLWPVRGVIWIARKIQESVRQRLDEERQSITSQLGELYGELDAGKITQEQFDERERALLDRLDVVKQQLDEIQ
jgi:hypothetical protein